ncbi:hypothetical protein BJ944DRAFT_108646, partial [Cunninghamella echinulata]
EGATYLIEWDGYDEDQNTWEPLENLLGNVQLIDQFVAAYNKQNPNQPYKIGSKGKYLLRGAFDPSLEDVINESTSDILSNDEFTSDLSSNDESTSYLSSNDESTDSKKNSVKLRLTVKVDPPHSKRQKLNGKMASPDDFGDRIESLNNPQTIKDLVIRIPVTHGQKPIIDSVEERIAHELVDDLVANHAEAVSQQHPLIVDPKTGKSKFAKIHPPVYVTNDVDKSPFPKLFVYIDDFIFGKGVEKPDPNFLVGCDCSGICEPSRGKGFCHNPDRLAYRINGQLRLNYQGAIFECNAQCKCDKKCINRIVQRGRKKPLEIFRTKDKGWGVRATEDIRERTYVEQYIGEVITRGESDHRGSIYDKIGVSYLFDMDLAEDQDGLALKHVIDSYIYGNASHFFNHSCDPNLLVYGVFYESFDPTFHRLAFFAKRNIKKGEELTFDYCGSNNEPGLEISTKFPCKCNEKSCRKWIHR